MTPTLVDLVSDCDGSVQPNYIRVSITNEHNRPNAQDNPVHHGLENDNVATAVCDCMAEN
jgi:hypothetical protein